ncbi:MAG: hypothetical protein V4714_14585 [Bacteroidota bacterium]
MAFRKKVENKKVIITRQRLSGVEQIDIKRNKTINYGLEDQPLTKVEIKGTLDAYTASVNAYNQLLMQVDAQSNSLKEMENTIGKIGVSILKGAASKFGDDADEVEMVGGTRASDRKAPVRKKKEA